MANRRIAHRPKYRFKKHPAPDLATKPFDRYFKGEVVFDMLCDQRWDIYTSLLMSIDDYPDDVQNAICKHVFEEWEETVNLHLMGENEKENR